MRRLAAVVELLRPPNVFTAVADALAGLALARGGLPAPSDPGLWCLPASACLYLGGMALNDLFDRETDARERPERPIPSGRVPPALAAALGAGLLASGLLFAALAGRGALAVAVALAAAIVLYDARLKDSAAGFLDMGLCRGLNLAMPLALAGGLPPAPALAAAVLLAAWVAAFTYLSRGEVGGNTRERARRGVGAAAAVAVAAAATLVAIAAPLLAWLLLAAVVARGAALYAPLLRDPSGPLTGRAIGGSILLIPVFDATFVAAGGHPVAALAVAALALPALALRRFYSPT